MGLLAAGIPIRWSETKQYIDYVKKHGIEELINLYHNNENKKGDVLLWGDEIEYMVVSFDHENKKALLSLRQGEILKDLAQKEKDDPESMHDSTFHPEYGRYMLEATPAWPYTGSLSDLIKVEQNMATRRVVARTQLKENECPITVTSFPRLGVPGQFTDPYYPPRGSASHSLFLPDEIINQHPRFPTLTANIRERRGSKVTMNVPIFKDKNTPSPFYDPTIPRDRHLFPEDDEVRKGAALDDHIYMDSMGFGMGCCCLQITFQGTDIDEARRLYDQLAPLGPIMLALTAASPAYRGFLSDQDCRWNVISGSVDDRTPEERGLKPLKNDKFVIPKSRYDSIDSYICPSQLNHAKEYNDIKLVMDDNIRKRLLEAGMDELLADHFAHLFIRDPLVIFKDRLELDDEKDSDHFENIQSTNWQTMRFKPPPPDSDIGWRVEFRSMEVQVTDFENAAFSVFVVLLTRAILSFGLNFYMPISQVDKNMQVAHHRDAINREKFWFRKDLFPVKYSSPSSSTVECQSTVTSSTPATASSSSSLTSNYNSYQTSAISSPTTSLCSSVNGQPALRKLQAPSEIYAPAEDCTKLMTLDEIINGSKGEDGFVGLIPLVERYLDSMSVSIETRCGLRTYLDLISKRASGELQTTAAWMRSFIRSHPDYKFDSVISDPINYDLMMAMKSMSDGDEWNGIAKGMLGGFVKTI